MGLSVVIPLLKVYSPQNTYVRPTKCFENFLLEETLPAWTEKERQEEMKESC